MRIWTLEEARGARTRVRDLVRAARDVAAGAGPTPNGDREARARRFRALVEQLHAQGVILRDVGRGLVDFPARSPSGRLYHLCWLVDEDDIGWWHWPEDGFAGRRPIASPPE